MGQSPEDVAESESPLPIVSNQEEIDWEEMFGEDALEEGQSRITLTMPAARACIVGIHICCAISRPVLDEPYFDSFSWSILAASISWLMYILFVPGALILLNWRIGSLSNDDIILILPLSLLWVLGVAPSVQSLWFFLGISNPIQWWNTAYISLFLTMLLYFRYSLRRSNRFAIDIVYKMPHLLTLFSCFVMLFLSIIGPTIFTTSGDNTVSMLAIFLIAIIPPLVMKDGGSGAYLLLYFSALSTLLVHSLVSVNVSGLDIQTEFYYSNNVLTSGSIDIFSGGHYSTVLSTQGIVPLISLWTGVSLTTVLKIIYPLIFSYSVILLFFSYSQLFKSNIPFIATLLTIYSVSFYTSMLDVVRQGFSEIFFLSAIVLMSSSDRLSMHRNRVFIVPFLVATTLSHYGINYILYPVFWLAYLIFLVLSRVRPFNFEDQLTNASFSPRRELGGDEEEIFEYSFNQNLLLQEENMFALEELQNSARRINPLLNIYHLLTGTVFLVLWHSFAGGGTVIQTVLGYSRTIIPRFLEFGLFGATSRAQPTQFVTTELQPLHEITKYLYMLIMLLSLPTLFFALKEENQSRPKRNFLCIAIASWMMFAFVFLVPNVAVRLHFPRIFHILAMFIFPFCASAISEKSIRAFLLRIKKESLSPAIPHIPRVLLISFFLLSSGFLYQLSEEIHRPKLDPEMDYASFTETEEAGSIWSNEFAEDEEVGLECVGADAYRARILKKYNQGPTRETFGGISNSKFVFISGYNIEKNEFYTNVVDGDNEIGIQGHYSIGDFLSTSDPSSSRIYDSGDAHWYFLGKCFT